MNAIPAPTRLLLTLPLLLLAGCQQEPPLSTPVTTGTQFTVTGNSEALYFDMQGLLWRLPAAAENHTAQLLTDAGDDLRRMQLSSDGQWLVAQSFKAGNWDIVIMRTDGSERRNLTQHQADDREPAWADEDQTILFTSDRAGNEDIWSLDIASGSLRQLTTDPAPDHSPAPLGTDFLFFSARGRQAGLYRGGEQNAPVLLHPAPAGKLYAPRVSPDGNTIAFVQAIERNGFPGVALNELVLLDVTSGALRSLSAINADVFGRPPAWLDNDTLLATIDGAIQRIDLRDSRMTTLPFSAQLPLRRSDFSPATPLAFSEEIQPMLGIVDPVFMPDDSIVFTAIGDLWRLHTDGTLIQLTDDVSVERDVAVSPDGTRLAMISDRPDGDSPAGDMQIWSFTPETGRMTKLTSRSQGPRYPTWSPDGKQLAYLEVGPRGTQDFTVRLLDLTPDAANNKPRKLRSSPKIWPGRMSFSADGTHLTVAELFIPSARAGDGRNRLVRINLAADTAEPFALPDNVTPDFGPVAAPAGTELALVIDGALWQLPLTADGLPAGPLTRTLNTLVESPAFSADGRRIAVLTNRGLEVVAADTGERKLRNPTQNWQPAADRDGLQIIHAGRLWDGVSDDYLTDMDIFVVGSRITKVEPHNTHPVDIRIVAAGDRTVLPGLVDHHVHFEPHKGEWLGRGLLAFGVTTVVEPGGLPYESREQFESWQSGRRLGPRLVFAGPQLDGARRTFYFGAHINSEQRLEWELDRGERLGYGLLKTYRRMRPELQQRTVELGHARGKPVTAHAGLRNPGFGGDRTEHLRGGARVIGSSKQSDALRSYADVLTIYAHPPAAAITPTVVGKTYFDTLLRYPELAETVQYTALYSPAYRSNLAGFTKFVSKNIDLIRFGIGNAGKTIKELDARGVNIVAGTDSPIFPYGLALVVELNSYVEAGLTPAAALRTATSNAAKALGAENEIGRIAPGYFADLVIIDGDPLAQMTDLTRVEAVMLNGRYLSLQQLIAPR